MKKILFILLVLPFFARGQIITTVAGNGMTGYGGDNGLATSAKIGNTGFIAFDTNCNYYFTENNNTIRKVSPAGIITTIAGCGLQGFSGDSGIATSARFNGPTSIAIDFSGNIYISDFYNNRIRKINIVTGIITTFAGNGIGGYNGDTLTATLASLWSPAGIGFDKKGNLYISDYGNSRIRKVDTFGIMTTIAGNGTVGYSGDNGQAISAILNSPYGLHFDTLSNLFFADGNRVRKINMVTGIITTVAGNGGQGFAGDLGQADSAELFKPLDVIVDAYGNLYISDLDNNRIRKVNTSGIISTIVGNGNTGFNGDSISANLATIYSPRGLALDKCGNLYISDNGNNRIRKVSFNPSCADTSCGPHVNIVSNIIANSDFSVYPNPVNRLLHIDNLATSTHYSISNMLGAVVLQGVLVRGSNSVNMEGLVPGVYVLELVNNEQRVVKKIVKE